VKGIKLSNLYSSSWACRLLILLGGLVLLPWSGSSASAAIFLGTYTGITADGSTLNSGAIPVGTPFTVKTLFSPTLSESLGQGARRFGSIVTATVDSIDYVAPGYYTLDLMDGTNTLLGGAYVAHVTNDPDNTSGFTGFFPGYLSATPAFSVEDLSPTVFGPYYASLSTSLPITTLSGDSLLLQYDSSAGVQFSITAVPEPASLGLLASCGMMALKSRRVSSQVRCVQHTARMAEIQRCISCTLPG